MSGKWSSYADCVWGYASDSEHDEVDVWLQMYQIQDEQDAIKIVSALSVQIITSKPRRLYILSHIRILVLLEHKYRVPQSFNI